MIPRISVIIPTYNRPELLLSSVGSVLNQTFGDFELIVVDDASTAPIEDVLAVFNDRRIKYIRHGENRGEAASRNTGIIHSGAALIGFLDDDDQWVPEKLQLQHDLLEKSPAKVGAVYSSYLIIEMKSGITRAQWVPKKRGDIHTDMVFDNFVGTPSTVLLRRECFHRVGLFDEGIPYGLDYDMWIRISREFQFDYIERPLVKYYLHESQLSNDLEMRTTGKEALLKKHSRFFRSNRKAYSNHIFEMALLYRDLQQIKKAKAALSKAIRVNPLGVGHHIGAMKCIGFFLIGKGRYMRLKKLKDHIFCIQLRRSGNDSGVRKFLGRSKPKLEDPLVFKY